MTADPQHKVTLEPLIEIETPVHEKWLFNNPVALGQLKQGIENAAHGKITKRDFSEYLEGGGD